MKKINADSIIYVFARIFSTVLSPLLMPTLGVFLALWGTVLCYIPTGTRLVVMLVVFGITCIMPMVAIAVMHNLKIIEDKRLVKREERWLPYIATVLCYICSAVYLHHIHTPQWVVVFMAGGAAACVVSTIVTLWWKISAHMAGIGGAVGIACRLSGLVAHIHESALVYAGSDGVSQWLCDGLPHLHVVFVKSKSTHILYNYVIIKTG